MRVLVQRVLSASVTVNSEIIGNIQKGILLFVGFTETDTQKELEWFTHKLIGLRIFEDINGKMNISVQEISAEILVIPQFTLYGDCHRGFRPDFTKAMDSTKAKLMFEQFVSMLKLSDLKIETGRFQADMKVSLINDGPVTLWLDN